MPKHKVHITPLRTVRDATGLSQQAFADAIGTTKAIVENVEMGRSALSPELLERIVAFAGLLPGSLASNKPRDFHGKPYSRRSWELWQQFDYTDAKGQELVELAKDYLELLLVAGFDTPAGKKTPHVFRSLLLDFNQWIFAKVRQHKLDWIIESRTLSERDGEGKLRFVRTENGTSTVGHCRARFAHHPDWQDNHDPAWKDSAEVTYTHTKFPLFTPFVGFVEIGGQPAFTNGAHKVRHRFDLVIAEKAFRVTEDTVKANFTLADDGKPLPPKGSRVSAVLIRQPSKASKKQPSRPRRKR